MRLLGLLLFLLITASLSLLVGIGCDDLTTEVNNNTVFDTTLGQDCLRCHSDDDNAIKQPKGQWANSRHASPDLIEAHVVLNTEDRQTNQCGPQCHTSQVFIAFIGNGSTSLRAAPSTIDCFTCHMPHTGVYGTWQLDTLRGHESPVILAGDFDYNMGNSNMCVTCHQAATIPVIPAGSAAVELDTLGMDGPHYSAQAHMLIGQGGFRFGNTNVINSHAGVATQGGCLKCHFGTGVAYSYGEHTFKLEDEFTGDQFLGNCNTSGCHAGSTLLTNFYERPIQDTIKSLADSLAGLLIAANILTGTDSDSTEYFIDSTVSADEARILFNYLMVKKDGSHGVHNAHYARTLLAESVQRWDSIPQAAFTASTLAGCVPLPVNFTNTSTGIIATYSWDFGAGTPAVTTPDATFTFDTTGIYTVRLTITGSAGTSEFTRQIVVDTIPTAAFTVASDTVVAGTQIQFTQTSIEGSSFVWDFGNGTTNTVDLNPVFSYADPGSYTVLLIVTNACTSDTATQVITVTAPL